MSHKPMRVLFTTSTMPASDDDPVPAFVKDEAISMKRLYPHLHIDILAPHNGYGNTKSYQKLEHYDEYRFHYFWPFRWETLTGKGIQPALKKNKLLYLQLPGLFIAQFFATLRLIRKTKPDVLYAHWFTPQALTGAVAAKLTGTPLVFDTQASDAIVLKVVPFSKKIVAWVCKQAVSYTVPSQQTLDKLLYFATPENKDDILSKVTMVPYGTNKVEVDATLVKRVEKTYKLKGKHVLYFIGRLVDRKGVDTLIEAFSELNNADDTLRLVIVGDGQDRAKLEALTKEKGVENSVIFTGFMTGNDRYGLLKLSTACVIPSVTIKDQSEGLPVVFMEGLMYGKPMVISDATGAHEIVDDGKNAIVVKSGDKDSLRDGIDKVLALDKKSLASLNAAALKLSEQFSWNSIAKRRYNALLKPIARKD